MLRDAVLAEDAVHELVTSLLRRAGAFREAEAPYRFLCRAIDRACIDLMRRRKHIDRARPLEEVDELGPAPGVDPGARRAVLDSLVTLDDEDQIIALASFVDGFTQEEIAHELGLSRVTINKRVNRIREHLRIELAERDGRDRHDANRDGSAREEIR